jgi:hypothetical protein
LPAGQLRRIAVTEIGELHKIEQLA